MKKQTHSQLPPEHSPACWSASPDLCLWSVGLLLASGVAEWAGLVQSTLPDSEPDLTNRKVKRSAFRDHTHTHKHFAHDPTKKSLSHQCVHFLHFSICMYAFWLVKYDWTRIHYVARRTWGFWPLEVASISWVCCSQADTLLVTPGWEVMAGAGLPISGWYTDAELAYWGSLTHTQTHLWAFLTAGQTRQKFLGKYFKNAK